MRQEAQARLDVAKDKTEALITEAKAESAHTDKFEGLRKFEQRMKLQSALQQLASNGKVILAGKNGQDVLNYYNKTVQEVESN